MGRDAEQRTGHGGQGGRPMALPLGVMAAGSCLVAVGGVVLLKGAVGSPPWVEAAATVALVLGGVMASGGCERERPSPDQAAT